MKGKFSLAVVVCLFLVGFVNAQNNVRVNEMETQAVFLANQLNTNLIVENSAQSFLGQIRLEVLDADDKILAQSETVETIKRGKHGLPIPLSFTQTQVADNLLWYRLRYAIRRENSPIVTSGIVSLSEIMPELFELQISASEKVFAGMRFRAHILALHPLTKKPIKNVNITGEVLLDLDEDELKINAVGKTNGEGFATLDFEIPQTAKLDDDGKIIIKGEKNGITREAKEDLDIPTESFVYLNLDKPIYQPNQRLFARGLYLNPAKRPLAEKELDFEILDEDDETIYKETVKTSRFGVATVSWQIPANIKLGKYRLEVENDDGDSIGVSEFKITRYDLPNFSVNAKTDKTFYLPEQKTAEISVGADYLFGKPVTKEKVRVVEETKRRWSYNAQKWEIEEAKSYEGVLNEEGKFTAQIDLSEAHENLRGDSWKRFEDLHFAAYFTDVSTNRTEQKLIDIRLTKESIHIYFIRHDSDVNPKLPFQFYVSTF
ncbi:MAG: MG2 domain-containing protein, partial [Acidobacteriota bacterium]|nr:MG2 domain-containing protein [Acidobacteriota bacterium]